MIERITKNTTDIFFTEALNFHLFGEDKHYNISQIAAEAATRGQNVSEVMAIVEKDGWKYDGQYHDGLAYVCSSYVAALWKAAGMFDDLDINAAEWSPKDVYQVKFFDSDNKNKRPQQCKDADPNGEFCQLLGKYRMEFPNFNAYEPYNNMNEKCPSVAPDFYRPDKC